MEYTFTWVVENYRYCFETNREQLISPNFYANELEKTTWFLSLFPRGATLASKKCISLFFQRSPNDDGPESISIKFKLSFLGIIESSEFEHTFRKGVATWYECLHINEDLIRREADYLPREKLSVSCTLSRNEGDIRSWCLSYARTRIRIKTVFFIHIVEDFSTLKPGEKKNSEIIYSKEDGCLTSSIYLDDPLLCPGRIMVEISPGSDELILTRCKISLLENSGNAKMCGQEDNQFNDTVAEIRKLSLFLRKEHILANKNEYLPEDKLSLLFECIFFNGVEEDEIIRNVHEIPSFGLYNLEADDPNKYGYNVADKLYECPGIVSGLKELYDKQLLTDVEIKTKTKSFHAHKVLLSARSDVFRRMLISDMEEKNKDCINLVDFEDDTVESFLYFLYSDTIERIPWKSAVNLYYAADKYAVKKLKVICSCILLDNITASTATELLLLADRHYDSELEQAVTHFILKHQEQVFASEEWTNLMKINSNLASKVMSQM